MNYKKGFFLLCIFFVLFISWAVKISIEEDPINVTYNAEYAQSSNLDLHFLKALSTDQLETLFPKQKLIDSIAFENPKELDRIVNQTLGLIQGDSMQVYRFFVKSIFEEIILKNDRIVEYSPEHLLHQIYVAENFKKYGENNEAARIYTSAIADLYFQRVSNKLEIAQQNEKSLVNKFSFQYLVQRCRENNYFPNRKETSIDKFMKTFLENDYFHLINTTIQKTTILQKIIIVCFLLFTTLGCLQTFHFIIKILIKNAKEK